MSFLYMKKNEEACGEFNGLILLSFRFSSRKSSVLGVLVGTPFSPLVQMIHLGLFHGRRLGRVEIDVLLLLRILRNILCIFPGGLLQFVPLPVQVPWR